MSAEKESEQFVQRKVNQLFDEAFGKTAKGRIQLAAYDIGDQVGILRGLIQERDALHAATPAAKPPYTAPTLSFGFTTVVVPEQHDPASSELKDGGDMMELFSPLYIDDEMDEQEFTPIEKATMARDAALEGARALYGLSERQAKRALKLAEKSFWLFNVADPTQN